MDLVWQWISLIKSSVGNDTGGTMAAYHDEMRRIARTNFLYRENGDPTDFASSAADLMFEYEPSLLLSGSSLNGEYNPTVASTFLDRFTPENSLITVWDQDMDDADAMGEGDDDGYSETASTTTTTETKASEFGAEQSPWKKERWYGAKYRETDIPPEVAERWRNPPEIDPRLHLPDLNKFIPTDFSLRCDDDKDVDTDVDVDVNVDDETGEGGGRDVR